MNILITGGAGFIGSNFVRLLSDKGNDNLYVLDCISYAADVNNLNGCNVNIVNGNIVKYSDVDKVVACHEIDIIVNFAAESHVDNSIKNIPYEFIDSNITGVINLLEIARRKKIKILHISTDEVYGSLDNYSPFSVETDILKPRNPYSATKAAAEHLCYSYWNTFGVDVTITRSSNNYGCYQYPEKLIPVIITRLFNGEKIPVYGEGKNIRDWLHVTDNCRAIELVMRGANYNCDIYNIGADNFRQNIEVVKLILSVMNEKEDKIEFIEDRLGHDFKYAVDASKIKTIFGWKPEIVFEKGIIDTVEWFVENHNWWRGKIK